ncbi:MAG TPA: hypothetical protein VGE58_02190 [Daejeonella sp.]
MTFQTLLKTLPLVISFVFLSADLRAQNKEMEARAAYLLAEESYGRGEYQSTLNFLDAAQQSLGAPNSKILFLKIQALSEISKTNKAVQQQLLTAIEQFQKAPDFRNFNEEKVLEVVKMKMVLTAEMQKAATELKQKQEVQQAREKLFAEYGLSNWPLNIPISALQEANKDSLLFKSTAKISDSKKARYIKYYMPGLKFNAYYPSVPENYAANNVNSVFTTKEGIVVAYDRVIYRKSKKEKHAGLEVSRAEILNMINKQNERLGPATITYQTPGQTTGYYTWKHGNKSIIWMVYLTPGPQWTATIVEEIFQPI